jgi:hypothetical protein
MIPEDLAPRNTGNDARSWKAGPLWLPTRKRKLGQRCWLEDHDGTYYRTYALIQAELDQAMARGRGQLAGDLIAEGLRVLEEGRSGRTSSGPATC